MRVREARLHRELDQLAQRRPTLGDLSPDHVRREMERSAAVPAVPSHQRMPDRTPLAPGRLGEVLRAHPVEVKARFDTAPLIPPTGVFGAAPRGGLAGMHMPTTATWSSAR